jgi:hypothetical protein
VVTQNFVTQEEADEILQVECHEKKSRASTLKRAPKAEFYVGDAPIWYYYQQHKSELENQLPMPTWMQNIGNRITDLPGMNHSIVISYTDGVKNFAPPHRDNSEDIGSKSGCLKAGAGFAVISVGEPRTFQLLASPKGPVVWEQKLPNRSMLWIPAEYNVAYWHAVPQDKSHKGKRASLVFRQIIVPSSPSSSSSAPAPIQPALKRKASSSTSPTPSRKHRTA